MWLSLKTVADGNIVCIGISSSVQPELLIVELNHSFFNRNVILISVVSWP
jgi:hypothetical protein